MGSYKYMKIIGKNKKTKEWELVADHYIGNGFYTHFGSDLLPSIKTYDSIEDLDHENLFLKSANQKTEYYCEGIVATDSFDEAISDCFNNIEKDIRSRVEYEKVTSSLEYLKLPEEEKENVKSSFEFDEEKYYQSTILELSKLKGLLTIAEDSFDYTSVYGLMYHFN